MEFRRLGRSGLIVSDIAYGNWITHGDQVEEDAAVACVRAALDEGITFFDTADVYAAGRAETVLAKALHGERRSSYVLASKVFWPTGDKPTDRGLSRKHVHESLHASLRRLQTDYLDIYYCHRFDPQTPLAETLRTFEDLVRAGKVLYVGISEWTAPQIREALSIADEMGFDRIVASQPKYNLIHRVPEAEVIPLSRAEGIGQVVFSPIEQGVLTGKYKPGEQPPAGTRAADPQGSGLYMQDALRDDILDRVQQLKPLAEQAGLSLAQLAVAWTLQNDNVTAAIIGASRPEQVRENVKASGLTLDKDLLTAIDELFEPVVVRG